MVVFGSRKRWDRWHIIPQLAVFFPLIYHSKSRCRTWWLKNATYLPPFIREPFQQPLRMNIMETRPKLGEAFHILKNLPWGR